ncbi:aldehyde dehydrogenase [Devosia sp. A369]
MKNQSIVKNPTKFFIGGEWVEPSSDATIEVFNSGTEESFLVVAEAKEADVNRAVAAARDAFDNGPWPRMTPAERAGHIRRFADEIEKLAEPHGVLWTVEAGALRSFTKMRALSIAKDYLSYANLADTFPFQERHKPLAGGEVALLVREPVGVVAAIVPWNAAPGAIASKLGPAMIAGCTVIVKVSPEAPGSAYIVAEAAENAGLPAGVVNILTAHREVSELLVRNGGVDKVAFTGSTAAGRRIGAICGERIARCTLELGGKSPAVIMDDYDIETAAKAIASRATFLTGQVCASLTRIIVTRERHDALVDALASEFEKVIVGDPFDQATQMGPLATRHHRDRVENYIEKGRQEGARLATGGGRPKHLNRGFFIEPTIFADVSNDHVIAREEIFGPVLAVIPADSEDHALTIANDSNYGLNASVFTNDIERAYSVARHIRSGTVGQNMMRNEGSVAFGGFKQSGIGREGGAEGLRSYIETKVVVLDGMPASAGLARV